MTMPIAKKDHSASEHTKCMMTRREFLIAGGASAIAASTVSITLFPGTARAVQTQARVLEYPRKRIAGLSQLQDNQPIDFNYPDEGPNSQAMLVKMGGVKAGGGIGPERDVVAFSYLCTHQGGNLQSAYKVADDQRVLGQCPLHLSTYDLRRHGIIVSGQAYQSLPQVLLELDGDDIYAVGINIVSGQAYQSLPQVLLELDGDDIYAVGIMGLLFGRHRNLLESRGA